MPCETSDELLAFGAMYRTIFSVLLICFLSLVALGQPKSRAAVIATNPFHEADSLFTFGENSERDKQSLAAVERGLAGNSGEYQWLWRAARVYYYVGDSAAKDQKLNYFQKGIDAGQRAVAAQPGAVEGHFWLGANYGGFSEQKGALKALQMVKKIRAEMETVLKLNDHYQDGGAYLALGEMDRQLPRIVGGSMSRAINRLEQGVKIAPQNPEMKLALGQAYQEEGRKEDARRLYQEIINRQINPSRAKSEGHVREKARRLLGKL